MTSENKEITGMEATVQSTGAKVAIWPMDNGGELAFALRFTSPKGIETRLNLSRDGADLTAYLIREAIMEWDDEKTNA